MWCVLLVLVIFCSSISGFQSRNDSSINCTIVDWSEVNTTNHTELDELFQMCLDSAYEREECPDPSLCESSRSSDENVGLAFGLTAAAGLSTTIGSLVPFVPFVRRSDTKYLAASLALAAGVMLYVSFTEIFTKSLYQFCCVSVTHQNLITTACFFFGIILTVLLDVLVKGLEKLDCGCGKQCFSCRSPGRTPGIVLSSNKTNVPNGGPVSTVSPLTSNGGAVQFVGGTLITTSDLEADENNSIRVTSSDDNSPTLHNHSDFMNCDPDNDRQTCTPNIERTSISAGSNTVSTTTNNLGDASIQDLLSNTSIHRLHTVTAESVSVQIEDQSHVSVSLMEDGVSQSIPNGDLPSRTSAPSFQQRNSVEEEVQELEEERAELEGVEGTEQLKEVSTVLGSNVKHLRRMGVLTGLAIALHNFPEGLATFIATLADPSLGAALAIAIALHNIPEGVCVSMPIYYATGSKLKGFFWAFLSGVSEPIGAFLGWVILQRLFGPLVYGLSFGIIAGMMVYISLKELLPTAQKFDKTNGIIIAVFLVVGMAVMALSLVLFYY